MSSYHNIIHDPIDRTFHIVTVRGDVLGTKAAYSMKYNSAHHLVARLAIDLGMGYAWFGVHVDEATHNQDEAALRRALRRAGVDYDATLTLWRQQGVIE